MFIIIQKLKNKFKNAKFRNSIEDAINKINLKENDIIYFVVDNDNFIEAMKAFGHDEIESQKMKHSESISVMESMDQIRDQVGLTFDQ